MPHDLTAQQVEEMLAALRGALDVLDCGIVLLAPDMRVRFVNRRFVEYVPMPPEVVAIGRNF
jgi:PAS domain-containing protein